MIDACETESTVGDADGMIIIYQMKFLLSYTYIFYAYTFSEYAN